MSKTRMPAPPYFRLLPPPTPGSAAYKSRVVGCARGATDVDDVVASAIATNDTATKMRLRSIMRPLSYSQRPDQWPGIRLPAGGLELVQLGVESAFRQQRIVCAAFHDLGVVDDENRVGAPHGVEVVRDDDAGAALHQ